MSALGLARWVLHEQRGVTHLALQKLVFYCYGAALAFDQESKVGAVPFEAWTHGPVNREVWEQCRAYGREPIPSHALGLRPSFDEELEGTLSDALAVYGVLDAWSLREQSHLERPWIDAFRAGTARQLEQNALKRHFKARIGSSPVTPPEYLIHTATFTLDGVPVPAFESFRQLANATRALRRC